MYYTEEMKNSLQSRLALIGAAMSRYEHLFQLRFDGAPVDSIIECYIYQHREKDVATTENRVS